MTCCNECNRKKSCGSPCGCAEPVFSVEPMPDDPTTLRFNVNGKSVWYDFESAIQAGETCTTLGVDVVNRVLSYHGECSDQTIAASELGSILHLADIGDVDAGSIVDNGILNYRKDSDCGEGCTGTSDGWVATNSVDVATDSMSYVLGTDEDGKMISLMPPADTTTFSYMAWRGANKVGWAKPTTVTTIPDDGTYQYPVYMDPNTGELVVYKKEIQ